MSNLQDQLNSFRKSLKASSAALSAAQKAQKKRPGTPLSSPSKLPSKRPATQDDSDSSLNSKRSKIASPLPSSAVSIASENTSAGGDAGSAHNLSLKLVRATDFIKECDRPVTLDELAIHMKHPIDAKLLNLISNLDRYKYDPMKKSLEYLSLHNIKTGKDLLKVLESQQTFEGLSVKKLKDGWNGCLETIAKLEKEDKIIVHKTKKENAPRHIWINYGNLKVGNVVNEDFYELWNKIKVPKTAEDLVQILISNGLKPTNVDPDSIKNKKVAPVQERKQKKPRRGKITNIHMKGILKDYSI